METPVPPHQSFNRQHGPDREIFRRQSSGQSGVRMARPEGVRRTRAHRMGDVIAILAKNA